MALSENLHNAKRVKNDEFYTQLKDIENYLQKFIPEFKGKYIYCNCDGVTSNFYIYFKTHFKEFGLRHLTATEYNMCGSGTRIDFDGTTETVTLMDFFDNGSFDCCESISVLKSCDIVVTNPPFSLFRKFYDLLKKYNKKFIVLGNWMAVSYANVTPDIISKKTFFSNYMSLSFINLEKQVMCCWYNNIKDVDERLDKTFTQTFNKDLHREADNWNWIVVKRQKDIPIDYYNLVAVPFNFFFTNEFWTKYEFIGFDNTPSFYTVLSNYQKQYTINIRKENKSFWNNSTILDGKVQFIKLICQRKKGL